MYFSLYKTPLLTLVSSSPTTLLHTIPLSVSSQVDSGFRGEYYKLHWNNLQSLVLLRSFACLLIVDIQLPAKVSMTASSFCNADSVFSREEGVDIRKMMEPKRSLCSVDQSNYTSVASKRHKADLSISTKERKEKIGERIVALQQLVSPFGKSDTASVLLEATHYISFLHKQVKVLSAPYLQCSPTSKTQDVEAYSLRSRGLCLVPVSYTIGVAQSNGADIWAPTKSASSQFN